MSLLVVFGDNPRLLPTSQTRTSDSLQVILYPFAIHDGTSAFEQRMQPSLGMKLQQRRIAIDRFPADSDKRCRRVRRTSIHDAGENRLDRRLILSGLEGQRRRSRQKRIQREQLVHGRRPRRARAPDHHGFDLGPELGPALFVVCFEPDEGHGVYRPRDVDRLGDGVVRVREEVGLECEEFLR
jgi:hypothetical protein